MVIQVRRIAELLIGHLHDELSEAEKIELQQWAAKSADNAAFIQRFHAAQTTCKSIQHIASIQIH